MTEAAVALALADEPALPRDMEAWLTLTLADEPWPCVLADTIPRGGPSGVVWIGGEEAAAWGEPDRVDMCFSIAKSALSTVAGLAWADGLLELDRPVDRWELEGTPITWRHLLTQTSDWRGVLNAMLRFTVVSVNSRTLTSGMEYLNIALNCLMIIEAVKIKVRTRPAMSSPLHLTKATRHVTNKLK